MLYTALVVAIGGGLASQTPLTVDYPDQIDILRAADTTPQILLLLDSSCSMGPESYYSGCTPSICSWYVSNRSFADCSGSSMSSNDMVKASLTGCTSDQDGILDKWDRRALFAIQEFGGSRTGLLENFDPTFSNHNALENAVFNLDDNGGTPMASAYVRAGYEYMNLYWNNSNTETCRQNFIVAMTDGVGNGPSGTASWISGSLTINDQSTGSPPYADAFAAYMFDNNTGTPVDALTNVTGTQPIRTYSIAFNAPPSAQSLLYNMAAEGDGAYYTATSYAQLDQAFTDIITSIVGRSKVSFAGNTVQNDGIFAGNYAYTTVFKPYDQGPWHGTTRKYCIIPTSPSNTDCLFYYPGGDPTQPLYTNPSPVDIWSAQTPYPALSLDATEGGSGRRIWNDLFGGVATYTDNPPSSPLTRRSIYTWEAGKNGYIRVDGTNLSPNDTWTNGPCEHYALLNKLHGYTYDVEDCANGDYSPADLAEWPEADTINGGTVLLKYSQDCESPGDRCYVATVSNAGMLHFFDAYSGIETSAIIPASLWQPNRIAHSSLSELDDQPNLESSRRFYFDGELRLFHDDNGGGNSNNAGNGIIDPGEPAHLIAPLGRGGAAVLSFPMTRFSGVPSATDNPPRPLYPDYDTGFQNLRDVWAAPWIGRFRRSGTDYAVAIFSNGHRRDADKLQQIGQILPGSGLAGEVLDTKSNPITHSCGTALSNTNWTGIIPQVCDPLAGSGLTPFVCTTPYSDVANNNCDSVFPPSCCYDWIGWQSILGSGVPWTWVSGGGIEFLWGPINWTSGVSNQQGVAYRVGFDFFQLQGDDYVAILDSSGNEVGRLTGQEFSGTAVDQAAGGTIYTPWVNDTSFYLHVRTDGFDSSGGRFPPFNIAEFQYVRRATRAAPSSTTEPTIYVVDANKWNGPNTDGSGGQGFAAFPQPGDTRQADALLARITSSCSGNTGPDEVCIDATTSPNTTDLAYMTCGISSEVSVLTEGGLMRSIYWIDRCGQIFKVDYNPNRPADPWSAVRLLNINRTETGAPLADSKDYRQGFAQLELVLSQCNGARSVGVYFGTGNIQRPARFDNLQDVALADIPAPISGQARNVLGVVWDHRNLPSYSGTPTNLGHLADVTNVVDVNALGGPQANPNGFYIGLLPNEKMLRKPVVLNGVAYFKTYQPTRAATECVSADGVDRFYVFDSCTAKALVDGNDFGTNIDSPSDRVAYSGQNDIGGEIFVYTPKDGDPVVAPPGQDGTREMPKNEQVRAFRLMMWRERIK